MQHALDQIRHIIARFDAGELSPEGAVLDILEEAAMAATEDADDEPEAHTCV